MAVEHLDFLVEEPSMEAALRELLPKMLNGLSFEVYVHQCKDDLLNRLPARLRGYAQLRRGNAWYRENVRIVVIVDRDDADCEQLKEKLDEIARQAGLQGRAGATKKKPWSIVNRIAIEELEAWYFGDWEAVRQAFPRVPESVPAQARYRDSDAIQGGTWEAFERVLQRAGYHKTGLRKIEAAREIAERMNPANNSSKSFQQLRATLSEVVNA